MRKYIKYQKETIKKKKKKFFKPVKEGQKTRNAVDYNFLLNEKKESHLSKPKK